MFEFLFPGSLISTFLNPKLESRRLNRLVHDGCVLQRDWVRTTQTLRSGSNVDFGAFLKSMLELSKHVVGSENSTSSLFWLYQRVEFDLLSQRNGKLQPRFDPLRRAGEHTCPPIAEAQFERPWLI